MNKHKPNQATLNRIITLALFVGASLLLYFTADSIGVTWDEPAYIPASQSYANWIELLFKAPDLAYKPAIIDQFWDLNHEHPPVAKVWAGLFWKIARDVFGSGNELTAIRLGPCLLAGFLVALLYRLIADRYGLPAGLFAALALLSMPRFFLHSHLANLDVAVSVMWFLLVFVFWKTVDRKGWAWGILWGVLWGLAVATKLNGSFIPLALLPWILIFRRKLGVVARLLLMGVVAAATFLLVWPWLYHDTWARIMEYIYFHVVHIPIGQWFADTFYLPPPWYYVYLVLWAVVPLTLSGAYLLGIVRVVRTRNADGGLGWLLLLNALVAILPFTFGKTLLYDSDRLFMPVYPFLAALAGIGFGWLVGRIKATMAGGKHRTLAAPASLLLAIGLLLPQSISAAKQYPHLLAYYSESVGGLPGATRIGFETTYWCETYAAALPYINEHASSGDTIWTQAWSYDVLKYYQKIGRLRSDVVVLMVGMGYLDFMDVDWYIFEYRQSQYGEGGEKFYHPLKVLSNQTPVFELDYQGIPLMKLYGRIR
jgi:4-amino-4-deoxy-L-arabinose transferase-like glycosyltransferase